MITKKQRKIYMTDEEWEKAGRLAKASGRSISEYFRSLLDLKVPRPLPPEIYKKIYRELSGIGNNLNQMARLANANKSVDFIDFKEGVEVVRDVRKMLHKATLMPEDLKK